MANFATNIVCFDGNPQRIAELRKAVQDDKYGMSGIDFNKIIPMPGGLWMGGINELLTEEAEHHGLYL